MYFLVFAPTTWCDRVLSPSEGAYSDVVHTQRAMNPEIPQGIYANCITSATADLSALGCLQLLSTQRRTGPLNRSGASGLRSNLFSSNFYSLMTALTNDSDLKSLGY